MQSPDDIDARLREIRRLRREGAITPEEAYRRHEALMRPATPVEEPPAPIGTTADAPVRAPSPLATPRLNTAVVATVVALVVAVILGGIAVAMIFDNDDEPAPPPSRAGAVIASPTRVPNVGANPVATTVPAAVPPGQPGAGCYDVRSPEDKIEIMSADPPLGGAPPNGTLRVTIRYTLASHDSARIGLHAGTGSAGASTSIGATTTVGRGSGIVTLIQNGSNITPQLSYYVYLNPPLSAIAGSPCFRPIFQVQLPYVR